VFVAEENIVCTLKWQSLKAKIGKTKKLSLVGLTPDYFSNLPKYYVTSSVEIY
jgi:hypothetical protein